jgi:hypothetical protein
MPYVESGGGHTAGMDPESPTPAPAEAAVPRAPWREVCGWAGWAVLVVAVVLVAGSVVEGFRIGVGSALHADGRVLDASADAVRLGVGAAVAGSLAAAVLALLGGRRVLLTLSIALLLVAGALTQVRVGA